MFVPYGRIYSLDAYRGAARGARAASAPSTRRCHAPPSGTVSRSATDVRPDFHVFTGNDLAIDMVCYGSDYLLGLSAFAPEAFAERDRRWAERRPVVPRAQRPAPVPRRVRVPCARPGLPPRRGACSSQLRGRIGSRRDPARSAAAARRRPCRARRHRTTPGSAAVTADAIVQVKRLRTVADAARPPRALGVADQLGVDDAVEPDGPARRSLLVHRRLGGDAHGRRTGSPSCRWRAGTPSPTAGPPTSCAAAGGASARAAPSSSGAAKPSRCGTTGAPTHASSCSTRDRRRARRTARRSRRRARRRARQRRRARGRPAAHALRPVVAPRRHVAAADRLPSPGARPAGRRRRRVVLSDDELDDLVAAYVDAAVLAADAGFDFVDVKHCHGYLLHELLGAVDRAGAVRRIDFDDRTAFLRTVVDGIRVRVPHLAIGVRLSAYDVVPYEAGADGVGVPVAGRADAATPSAATASGWRIDLTETHRLLRSSSSASGWCASPRGARTTTRTSSGRPSSLPPTATRRPRTRSSASARHDRGDRRAGARASRPRTIVGSGYSYLQQWLPHAAQHAVRTGGAASVGIGRGMLSYPDLPADVLAGRPLDAARLCRTFSDCTTAPRNGLVSGCFPSTTSTRTGPSASSWPRSRRRRGSARGDDLAPGLCSITFRTLTPTR